MSFQIFTYVPLKRALMDGLPARVPNTKWFVPGIRSIDDSHIIAGIDAASESGESTLEIGELGPHRFALTHFVTRTQYLGFENYCRPFFFSWHRTEQARHLFPTLLDLHDEMLRARRHGTISASNVLLDYWRSRSWQSLGDRARFNRWLARLDVVVPGPTMSFRQVRLHRLNGPLWPEFAKGIREIPALGPIKDEVINDPGIAYQTNSYIMRSELFLEFGTILFDLIEKFIVNVPHSSENLLTYLASRLFAIFLYSKRLSNSLLRVSDVPLLLDAPRVAPKVPPPDFDPAGYLRFNPDVANAGQDPTVHYIMHGWKEDREWGQN